MRAVFHINNSSHQICFADMVAEGLRRNGIEVIFGKSNIPQPCDFAITWGAHQDVINRSGRPHLIMERGHIQPRAEWVSLGWNGLAGLGFYPMARDGGERFSKYFGHLLKPWRTGGDYALVMGQTPGDAAVKGINILQWSRATAGELLEAGYQVRYRPHPNCRGMMTDDVPGFVRSTRTLDVDLRDARLVVTYSSTSAVEAVLAGVPTITMSPRSIAWKVTPHRIEDAGIEMPRDEWCANLAWTQWSPDELRSGYFWKFVRQACPSF